MIQTRSAPEPRIASPRPPPRAPRPRAGRSVQPVGQEVAGPARRRHPSLRARDWPRSITPNPARSSEQRTAGLPGDLGCEARVCWARPESCHGDPRHRLRMSRTCRVSAVELVLRGGQALADQHLDRVDGLAAAAGRPRRARRRRTVAARSRPGPAARADGRSRAGRGRSRRCPGSAQRAQAVVAVVAAAELEPHARRAAGPARRGARRAGRRDLVEVRQAGHRAAGVVHEARASGARTTGCSSHPCPAVPAGPRAPRPDSADGRAAPRPREPASSLDGHRRRCCAGWRRTCGPGLPRPDDQPRRVGQRLRPARRRRRPRRTRPRRRLGLLGLVPPRPRAWASVERGGSSTACSTAAAGRRLRVLARGDRSLDRLDRLQRRRRRPPQRPPRAWAIASATAARACDLRHGRSRPGRRARAPGGRRRAARRAGRTTYSSPSNVTRSTTRASRRAWARSWSVRATWTGSVPRPVDDGGDQARRGAGGGRRPCRSRCGRGRQVDLGVGHGTNSSRWCGSMLRRLRGERPATTSITAHVQPALAEESPESTRRTPRAKRRNARTRLARPGGDFGAGPDA